MKKITLLILLGLILTACGSNQDKPNPETPNTDIVENEEDNNETPSDDRVDVESKELSLPDNGVSAEYLQEALQTEYDNNTIEASGSTKRVIEIKDLVFVKTVEDEGKKADVYSFETLVIGDELEEINYIKGSSKSGYVFVVELEDGSILDTDGYILRSFISSVEGDELDDLVKSFMY